MPAPPTLRSLIATASWPGKVRWILRAVTPWGVEWWLRNRPYRRAYADVERPVLRDSPPADRRVEEAISFLVDRGLDEQEVREGSMPGASLAYVADALESRLPVDRPTLALHVGNFVGVSLCFFSWLVRDRHPDSVVVSVDPNVSHRGVEDPQSHVLALLHRYGLLASNLIVPGYTLDHRIDADALAAGAAAAYLGGLGCENVIENLARLSPNRFDLLVLDGDHDAEYLRREIAAARQLLADGAIVVLDDVSQNWSDIVHVFSELAGRETFTEVGADGRVGLLQARA